MYSNPFLYAANHNYSIIHSGEDRLVKKSFKELKRLGIYSDVARDVIRPSAEECARNPRSKSTKMRWAVMNQ